MGSVEPPKEVSQEIFPYIRVYSDGTFLRLAGTEVASPGLDPATSVLSKDVPIYVPASKFELSARVYIPSSALSATPPPKLPLILYFHGGAFIISSTADPKYHNSLNAIVSCSDSILVSLDYRRCPEHPLPAAFDDSWTLLLWILSQSQPETPNREPWLEKYADFERVFLAGDSGGANMAHHLALRVSRSLPGISFPGMIMIHPYFWGKEPIGKEKENDFGRRMVDGWWRFVCPSDKGNDDPLINPFPEGKCPEGMGEMPVRKVIVTVAAEDMLRDRGRLYYEMLMEKSGWKGKGEMFETEGAGHVFHIMDHESDKAKDLFKRLARFINET
ncbi:hypothetical protein MLD38_001767 [Melastoma candidum]|uniref:Uncharacterized protein n=1 Tax=Melastoma candidum TaxID=119954 RepID=A0ACB9SFK0_9MYRT|nr:hypothetical protein MLD38_001767 [Melastoma candidum]